MKCPMCNEENVNDAVFCANCGASITPIQESEPQPDMSPGYQPPQSYMPPAGQMPPIYQPPQSYMPPASDPKGKKALVGMILGIVSLMGCCISLSFSTVALFVMLAIFAVMGIVAIFLSAAGLKSQTRHGMAIAGLVCGIVGTLLTLALIALLAFGMYIMESNLYEEIMEQYYSMIVRHLR